MSAHQDHGFTLLETLIVVALLSALAAFAVPSVRTAQESYQLETTTRNVAQKLQEARTDSLKRNRQTWLLVNIPARSAQIQTNGAAGPVNIGFPEQLPQGVNFAGLGAGPTVQLLFDTMGRPVAPPITFQMITINGMTRTITVASTGRVTIN